MPDDEWHSVWATLTDDSLEHRLRHYYWLTTVAPNLHIGRFAALVEEAKRRGKPEIAERARRWVDRNGVPSPLA